MNSFKFVLICMSVMLALCAGKTKKHPSQKPSKANRMIGGQPVDVKTIPFIVSIKNVPLDYHKCAGFLVSDKHVVTTATCLYPASKGQAQAYLYPSTLDNLDEGYELTDWVIHYNYSVLPHENDIAVAILKTPIPGLRATKFPALTKWASLPAASEVTTYGWGYSKIDANHYGNFTMHSKKLKVMSNAMCSLLLHEYLHCSTICGSSDAQFASATADVGTPLLYKQGSDEYYVGMLTSPTEKLVSAATFTALYEYREFIKEVMEGPKTTASPETTTVTTTTLEPQSTTVEDEDYSEESEDDDEPVRGRKRKPNRRHHQGMTRFGKYRSGN